MFLNRIKYIWAIIVILLTGLVSCEQGQTISTDLPVEKTARAQNSEPHLPLGMGYDSSYGGFVEEQNPCLVGEYRFIPNRSLKMNATADYTVDELMVEVGAGVEVSATVFLFVVPVTVSGGVYNRTRLISTDMRMVLFSEVDYNAGSYVLDRPTINREFVPEGLSAEEIKRRCGDKVATRVQLGAKMTVGIEFTMDSKAFQHYLKAWVTGEVLGFEKTFTFANGNIVDKAEVHATAKIFASQTGGNELYFEKLIEPYLGTCDLVFHSRSKLEDLNKQFKPCLDKYRNLVRYVRGGRDSGYDTSFAEQISAVSYQTFSNSQRGGFAPIKYQTATYGQLGFPEIASAAEGGEIGVERSTVRKELMRIYLALDALTITAEALKSSMWSDVYLEQIRNNNHKSELDQIVTAVNNLKERILSRDGNNVTEHGWHNMCKTAGVEECKGYLTSAEKELEGLKEKYDFVRRNMTI